MNVINGNQLTFTPNWGGGKRSSPSSSQNLFESSNSNNNNNNNVPQSINCNPKIDAILIIYRLIQNEAQKMLDCNQPQKK